MTISERDRHELHTALAGAIGAKEAATLMEHLPPVGWADVATKRDLDALRGELGAELRAEMERGFRRIIQWNVSIMVALTALAFTAARIV